jgi:hypothetical protein
MGSPNDGSLALLQQNLRVFFINFKTRAKMNVSEQTTKQIATAAKHNTAAYLVEIPPEIDPARRLLEQYSGFAPEHVDAHIYEIVRHLLQLVSK